MQYSDSHNNIADLYSPITNSQAYIYDLCYLFTDSHAKVHVREVVPYAWEVVKPVLETVPRNWDRVSLVWEMLLLALASLPSGM